VDSPLPIDAPPRDADVTPPAVFATMPASGATNVPATSTVRVQFTEAVSGVSTTTFFLTHNTTMLGGTISPIDPQNYVFIPTGMLPANATIVVNLTSAILDASQNPLAATSFSFQTAP
jgi:hypothetical protein